MGDHVQQGRTSLHPLALDERVERVLGVDEELHEPPVHALGPAHRRRRPR
jgi:hypothetical protein